jgi:hypothetical protein
MLSGGQRRAMNAIEHCIAGRASRNYAARRKYQRVVLLHTPPDEVNIANHKLREEL